MAERLVTQSDLNKYPELKGKGVSVNQHYDFSYLEQQEQTQKSQPSKEVKQPKKQVPVEEEDESSKKAPVKKK